MTDLELKELVANLAVRQTDSEQRMNRAERYLERTERALAKGAERHKEIDKALAESAERHKEIDKALAEGAERHKEIDKALAEGAERHKAIDKSLAEGAERHKEIDLLQRENAREIKETDRQIKELSRETDRQIKELGKQLGGLGQKFGGFTEGMAFPSMKKILTERFHMTDIGPWRTSHRDGRTLEIDVLAHADDKVKEVYVVEVKSTLREEGLEQMLRILREFHDFFSGHRGKKLYGILAAVNVPDNVRNKVLKAGIYLARIHDESFEISVPENFQPRAY